MSTQNLNNSDNSENSDKFSFDDIPLGKCIRCGVNQINKGQEGYWICGLPDRWACYKCKYGGNGPEIPSRAFACEWCTYKKCKWVHGGYSCPRCDYLGIPKK